MYKMNKARVSKLLIGTALLSLVQLIATPTWAADCSKAADSKNPVCVKATAKPGAGSQMQTVPQASAAEQKKAAQTLGETRTAVTNQKPNREMRTWVGKTQLDCRKGTTTLHVADAAAPCPPGFKKS